MFLYFLDNFEQRTCNILLQQVIFGMDFSTLPKCIVINTEHFYWLLQARTSRRERWYSPVKNMYSMFLDSGIFEICWCTVLFGHINENICAFGPQKHITWDDCSLCASRGHTGVSLLYSLIVYHLHLKTLTLPGSLHSRAKSDKNYSCVTAIMRPFVWIIVKTEKVRSINVLGESNAASWCTVIFTCLPCLITNM